MGENGITHTATEAGRQHAWQIAEAVADALGSGLASMQISDTEDVNGWGIIRSYDIQLANGDEHLLYLAPEPTSERIKLDTSAVLEFSNAGDAGQGIKTLAWLYPNDPVLQALPHCVTIAGAEQILRTLDVASSVLLGKSVAELELVGYRPGKRAVLRAVLGEAGTDEDSNTDVTASTDVTAGTDADTAAATHTSTAAATNVYLKVVPPATAEPLWTIHTQLRSAGLPVPEVLAWSPAGLLVMRELDGQPLSERNLDTATIGGAIAHAQQLVARVPEHLLVGAKPPVTTASAQYAKSIAAQIPALGGKAQVLSEQVCAQLKRVAHSGPTKDQPEVPIHGDLHSEQIFVDASGQVTGILDLERLTQGVPEDDLAVFAAHEYVRLNIFELNAEQTHAAKTRLHAALGLARSSEALFPRVAAMLIAHAAGFAVAGDEHSSHKLLELATGLIHGGLPAAQDAPAVQHTPAVQNNNDENSLTLISNTSHQG